MWAAAGHRPSEESHGHSHELPGTRSLLSCCFCFPGPKNLSKPALLLVRSRDGNSGMGTQYPSDTRPDGYGYGYGDDFLFVGDTCT
jgi:hypothetical protein